ncbi:transmembrane 9 superfamily member 4-like [Bidens hawaiensis]|uniref:transmembrane 9 superfamily member 4-like n=1 Tax=Bidens hawaiensis TaxID=980011 RepID=UPI00404B9137
MVNVTDDIEADVEFTYSVKWFVTQQTYDKKMDMFTDYLSVPLDDDVLGYSIANTRLTLFILIICILVFTYEFFAKIFLEADNQEEMGWKNIHGDVFRFPKHKSLFAATLGSGTLLLHGSDSCIGRRRCLSAISSRSAVIGKNRLSDFQAPCRTTICPKKIPKLRWCRRVIPQMALAGLLSFNVIIIQMHGILDAVWGYKIYTSYVSMLIILFLLLIMTALVSMVTTYFQLGATRYTHHMFS